uniref:Putative secreted protein n=1 Tax=Ixodes ricinus TaxID=34613 RepID=A0A147BJI8_IXORI
MSRQIRLLCLQAAMFSVGSCLVIRESGVRGLCLKCLGRRLLLEAQRFQPCLKQVTGNNDINFWSEQIEHWLCHVIVFFSFSRRSLKGYTGSFFLANPIIFAIPSDGSGI